MWSGSGSAPCPGTAPTGDPSPPGSGGRAPGPRVRSPPPPPLRLPRSLPFLTGHFVPGQGPSLGVRTSGHSLALSCRGCVLCPGPRGERLVRFRWACLLLLGCQSFSHVPGPGPLSGAHFAKNARPSEMNCMLFLFDQVRHHFEMSFFEVYNEKIHDLLVCRGESGQPKQPVRPKPFIVCPPFLLS